MNHAPTDTQRLSQQAELSRVYHDHLKDIDEAIRALEADPARYTVAEYNDLFSGLIAERARRVEQYQRERDA